MEMKIFSKRLLMEKRYWCWGATKLKESTTEDFYITNQWSESIMICSENIKLYLDQLELLK